MRWWSPSRPLAPPLAGRNNRFRHERQRRPLRRILRRPYPRGGRSSLLLPIQLQRRRLRRDTIILHIRLLCRSPTRALQTALHRWFQPQDRLMHQLQLPRPSPLFILILSRYLYDIKTINYFLLTTTVFYYIVFQKENQRLLIIRKELLYLINICTFRYKRIYRKKIDKIYCKQYYELRFIIIIGNVFLKMVSSKHSLQ